MAMRKRRKGGEVDDVPRATREDVEALIVQLNYPHNRREVEDFAAVARGLVREARRYGVPIPPWLAAVAGFREPPAALRFIRGGRSR